MCIDELRESASRILVRIDKVDPDGQPLDLDFLLNIVSYAISNLESVDSARILQETLRSLYSGITESELYTALIISSRTLIEIEPNYSYVTARILLYKMFYKDVAQVYNISNIDLINEEELQKNISGNISFKY